MLQPKRTKFRKMQKGRNRGLAQTGNKVSFGEFGFKSGCIVVVLLLVRLKQLVVQ